MANWEDSFQSWAKPPGITEREKCENAETAVRKALAANNELSAMAITVLPQGSYRNKTNVRSDSDVDICMRLTSTFFEDYPAGKTRADFGNIPGTIAFSTFRNLVQKALENYFGAHSVTRGDKAFDIHANTYRIDADVVAALEHRRYRYRADNSYYYSSGIAFDTDAGKRIVNWPEQNYTNGLNKHENTGRRFRKIVRILKHLRNKMHDENIAAADGIASCLIEHLVYNAPSETFGNATLQADVRATLIHVYNATLKDESCESWVEMNGMEWLFKDTKQPWSRQKANEFIVAGWQHLEFK